MHPEPGSLGTAGVLPPNSIQVVTEDGVVQGGQRLSSSLGRDLDQGPPL